ncbi:hypothetical protein [Fibrobacter sp.]|uniref:hypothetical protein n=1 Tax=Fibrobacter sp. TaxID=35828 RepID=UPI0038900288
MNRIFKIVMVLLSLSLSAVFADEAAAPVADSATTVATELKQEIALRDSVMQVQGNACSVEKDSLRAVIETEKAKSDNWEKSYNTVKKDNETCAQMLVTSIGMNEKKQEKEQEDRRAAAMATSSSFLGGVGIGLLIMWLIMK